MENQNLTDLQNHLQELEERLLESKVEIYSELLSDEFFEFGSSGNIWVKSDFEVEGGSLRQLTLSQFKLHPLSDDVALVTYHIYQAGLDRHTLRSSIWKCIDGKWKMFFHQGTPTHLTSIPS